MEAMRGEGSSLPREGRVAQVQGIRSEAAEGIRTLDLLHGNYTGRLRIAALTHTSFAGLSELARSPIFSADMNG